MFAQVVRISPRNLLAALALTAVVATQGRAEHPGPTPSYCPFPSPPGQVVPPGVPPVVPPVMPRADVPPERRPAESEVTTPQPPAETEAPPAEEPGAFAMGLTPSVFGDLLFTSRSVSFGFIRINGITNFNGLASTSIVNANVADDNSPLPRDRVYFRYNYFHNAQAVTGLSPVAVPQIPGQPTPLVQLPATRKYDTNTYTFALEKTFFDSLISVELRAPVVTGLASHNTFSVGNPDGLFGPTGSTLSFPNQNFGVLTTPENTLGHEDTEFGNLTVILKGLLYQNSSTGLSLSAGTGVTIPTGEDTRVGVIDYSSFVMNPFASLLRQQNIVVKNETWSLAPFLAALYRPNDRLFTQGFASIEVPLGSSRISYIDQHFAIPVGSTTFAPIGPPAATNLAVGRRITEQTLSHLDWNVGYWVYRDPDARWLTGIAPAIEVHYTSALDNAERVQLPNDGSTMINPKDPTGPQIPAPGPVVGGQRNRLNIVDLTAGTTFLIRDRATLATAFSVPVSNGRNKTFDWEFQLQLNYYFGGPTRGPVANVFR